MKRLILIVLLVLPITLAAQPKPLNDLFKKYSGKEGYTTIEMSGKMFSMVNQLAQREERELSGSLGKSLDNIKKMIMIVAEDDHAKEFETNLDKVIEQSNYESISSTSSDGSRVDLYITDKSGEKKDNDFLIKVCDSGSCIVIAFTGKMTLKDVAQLSKITVSSSDD